MDKLFKVLKNGEITQVPEKEFGDEVSDMEDFVKKNISTIKNLIIFGEQATPGGGIKKRVDLFAVDRDTNRIFIIELKSQPVDPEIISQISEYWHIWNRKREAIQNIWLQSKNRLDDLTPDFNSELKVMIIAPYIENYIVALANEVLNFDINFIEITRFQEEDHTFLIVTEKEFIPYESKGPTTKQEIDWEFYLQLWNEKILNAVKEFSNDLVQSFKQENREINIRLTKFYISFRHGSRVPFWIERKHVGKICLGINVGGEEHQLKSNNPWKFDKSREYWYLEFTDATIPEISNIFEDLKDAYDKN
jgi:hypothetical protein